MLDRALACRKGRIAAACSLLLRPVLACAVLLGTLLTVPIALAPAALASNGDATAATTGFVRLANLSPGEPMFDVYLYPVGNAHATLMLKNIGYGMVSGYKPLAAGTYTVAIRKAGNPASSTPVLSTTVSVTAGHAYTIASVGPSSAPRLEVLNDMLTPPKGKALVRIIQAAQGQPVTVTANGHVLVRNLAFGKATSYATVKPDVWNVRASAGGMTATDRDTWAAGSSYTVVVLKRSGKLELACLTDGSGSKVQPSGGAEMGFGGMARTAPSVTPWLTGMAGGVLLMAGGALWLRRAVAAAGPRGGVAGPRGGVAGPRGGVK